MRQSGSPWPHAGRRSVHDSIGAATTALRNLAASTGLGDHFSLREEFYTFRENPRNQVHVLLRLNAPSVGASGDYPLAWTPAFGQGRVYYNALGHFSDTWTDSRFLLQMAGAIRWVAGTSP